MVEFSPALSKWAYATMTLFRVIHLYCTVMFTAIEPIQNQSEQAYRSKSCPSISI